MIHQALQELNTPESDFDSTFSSLYWAWWDLIYYSNQSYYWDGADLDNIEDIVVTQARLWLKENEDVIEGLLQTVE